MLTYELKKTPGVPLYEALYRCIRSDILSGVLKAGERLPSKRALAANLEISKITVEAAYGQLMEEGYIRSREKAGYFVEVVERLPAPVLPAPVRPAALPPEFDLTGSAPGEFPFSVWSKLQREVMLDLGEALLLPLDNRGVPELRKAIADHLAAFRGMRVDPGSILVGAGTDFLYNLLIQLLGRDKLYAVEEPGYRKIRQIYAAGGVRCVSAALDGKGVRPDGLGRAQVLHISPSHHFPTGLITPPDRRMELLAWAEAQPERFIIEDDYDSEFRFNAHPMPAMASLDRTGRVIYMNTFSKTLAPSIRISYMILPPQLMEAFQRRLGFYGCTVPSFEQHTLARFLGRGYFEKHINRMRRAYKNRRDRLLSALKELPYAGKLTVLEEDAGLHFLVRVDTALSGEALARHCGEKGIRVAPLSRYYDGQVPPDAAHSLVVNYSGLTEAQIEPFLRRLETL